MSGDWNYKLEFHKKLPFSFHCSLLSLMVEPNICSVFSEKVLSIQIDFIFFFSVSRLAFQINLLKNICIWFYQKNICIWFYHQTFDYYFTYTVSYFLVEVVSEFQGEYRKLFAIHCYSVIGTTVLVQCCYAENRLVSRSIMRIFLKLHKFHNSWWHSSQTFPRRNGGLLKCRISTNPLFLLINIKKPTSTTVYSSKQDQRQKHFFLFQII